MRKQKKPNNKLVELLGKDFGSVKPTGNIKNKFVATSSNELNIAFGGTEDEALRNLLDAINKRKENNS